MINHNTIIKFKQRSIYILDSIKNLFVKKGTINYVVEAANWSIYWDGYYITSQLNKIKKNCARITTSTLFLKKCIIHYGSPTTYFNEKIKSKNKSNKYYLTWFHISPLDKNNSEIPTLKIFEKICTSTNITKAELEKRKCKIPITVIPLGVDTKRFKIRNKKKLLRKYKIPKDSFIIGSFQKDGNGWQKGNEPKLIKGPDLFVKIVNKIKNKNKFVLLSGPARGYIKNKLKEYKIKFKHIYLKDYKNIAELYSLLDIYLVTSRVEGGPKALLEGPACGIPTFSFNVGMAKQIISNNNGKIISNYNISEFINQLNNIKKFDKEKVRKTVINYDWKKIAKQYYEELYENKHLLQI